jgi:3'(2'), 5'-bisphosphate nucleotidase
MKHAGDYCAYLDDVRAIAADASQRILEIYERDYTISTKGDGSPLTEADCAAHTLIVARLKVLNPDMPVLSEESAETAYEDRADWKSFWLVDPLDGTKEFIKRNGEFTVNIALIEGESPVLGVVSAPAVGVMYWACQGHGAFKQDAGRRAQRIRARAYQGGKAQVVASRSHPGEQLARFLSNVAHAQGEPEMLSMGSALKLCLVAEGAADVYPRFGPTSEWDTAAAHCVVQIAGGRITTMDKAPLRYNKRSLLNPWFLVSGAGDYDWSAHLPDA